MGKKEDIYAAALPQINSLKMTIGDVIVRFARNGMDQDKAAVVSSALAEVLADFIMTMYEQDTCNKVLETTARMMLMRAELHKKVDAKKDVIQ